MKFFNLLTISIWVFTSGCIKTENADIVLHNGFIQTNNHNFSFEEAMAIRGDSILEVGKQHEILNRYNASEYIDLTKAYVYPSILDAHSYALQSVGVNLLQRQSVSEVCELINSKIALEDFNLHYFFGLDSFELYSEEIKECIEQSARGVIIFDKSGYKAIINRAIQSELGLESKSYWQNINNPELSKEVRNIKYRNGWSIFTKKAFFELEEKILSSGYSEIGALEIDTSIYLILKDLEQKGDLNLNISIYLKADINHLEFALKNPPLGDKLIIKGFIYRMDSYSEKPLPRVAYASKTKTDSLDKLTRLLQDYHYQLLVQCFSEEAITKTLLIFEKYLKGSNDKRWRIENFGFVNSEILSKCRKLSIIPIIFPIQKGITFSEGLNLQSFNDSCGMFGIGSGYPIGSYSFKDISQNLSDQINQPLSFTSYQIMSLFNAVSLGSENQRGQLAKGKKADFFITKHPIEKIKLEDMEYEKWSIFKDGKKIN